MDRQSLRKASFLVLFVITLGFATATLTAAPLDGGSVARQQADSSPSSLSVWFQELWETILSIGGTAPEPEVGESPPESPDGDANVGITIDPSG